MQRFLNIKQLLSPISYSLTKQAVSRAIVNPSKGFTFLELIIVIAIIGILAGIGVPSLSQIRDKAKITRAIAEITILEKEILFYETDKGKLPLTLDDINRGDLNDPWGNPYQYLNFETVKGKGVGPMRKDHMNVPINDTFDLYSMGRDGKTQTPLQAKASRDDIIRANNGAYIGPASGY